MLTAILIEYATYVMPITMVMLLITLINLLWRSEGHGGCL